MKRILLTVAYDGTDFSGFADLPGKRTIEGALGDALTALTGEPSRIIGASRTDAGVHAYGNLAVCDTNSPIPPERIARALDRYLPPDVRIVSSREVPADFHPRRLHLEKTYEYRIRNTRIPDPIAARYSFTYGFPLDAAAMRRAAADLIGEHDFTSMCNPDSQSPTRIRRITALTIEERSEAPSPDPIDGSPVRCLTLRVCGCGFLYHQVRIITGTLLEIGRGLRAPEDIPEILGVRDRRAAGFTAPPQGLFLMGYVLPAAYTITGA